MEKVLRLLPLNDPTCLGDLGRIMHIEQYDDFIPKVLTHPTEYNFLYWRIRVLFVINLVTVGQICEVLPTAADAGEEDGRKIRAVVPFAYMSLTKR